MADGGIRVVNSATGEVLEGEDAPRLDELDGWLDLNQGWEVVPREAEEGDDENSKADDENSNSNSEVAVVQAEERRPEPKIGPDGEIILPQVCVEGRFLRSTKVKALITVHLQMSTLFCNLLLNKSCIIYLRTVVSCSI